jgi:hypothetical protein
MRFTIENPSQRLVFDSQEGRFVAIENRTANDQVVKFPVAAPLFQLAGLRRGQAEKQVYLPSGTPAVTSGDSSQGKELRIVYRQVAGDAGKLPVEVEVVIQLAEEAEESTWRINLENRSEDLEIVEVLFPYLRGISLGERWDDDVIVYPHHAGEQTVAPAREYVSERFLGFDRAETRRETGFWSREINYCGLASMQWMDYYDPQGGMYFASHDADFLVTGLRVETGGPDAPWMGFAFRKYHRIAPGERWESHPYVLALTGSDWHWGARRYRAWIDEHIRILPNPDFLSDEFSLTKLYALKREGKVINRYERIPEIYRGGAEAFHSRHLFVAAWNRGGFDTDYPEYQPDMDLGSPLDLANACQEVADAGGHVTFYINARIFDTSSPYFKTQGCRWAIKDEKGEMKQEHYDWERFFSVSCPAEGEWQRYLMDIACWMVKAYGAKGIYLDQLGSAEPLPCYDPTHTHADIGDFNHGYRAILEELRRRLKEIDPDTYLMIENCGDIYSPYLWANLVWNGQPYDEFFNLYKYTFPEHALVHMVNPITDLDYMARAERFYRDMERATLLGAIFWLGLEKFTPEDAPLLDYARKVVAFREKIQPMLKTATYRDQEGVEQVSPGLAVSYWRLPSGQRLILLGNREEANDLTFTVRVSTEATLRVRTGNIAGTEKPVRTAFREDRVVIQAPGQTLSYVLLDPEKEG